MNKAILNQEVQQFINDHLHDSPAAIALKKSPFTDVSSQELAQQIDSKIRSEKKLPLWFSTPGIYFPPKLSIEQTSSETTAEYKSRLICGDEIIDLTGGFGVDSYYFSKKANVTHVEINENLSSIAEYNAQVLNALNIQFICGNGLDVLRESPTKYSTIYIDPSRRVQTKKVFRLKDCEPDVVANLSFLFEKASRIIIKTAPLLDIQSALKELNHVREVHVLSVKNDCKELLWVLDKKISREPNIICVAFNESEQHYSFKFSHEKAETDVRYSNPLAYVYEPDVALLKAGCFKLIARDFDMFKLHPNSHLYTSEEVKKDFMGRIFEVVETWDYKSFQSLKSLSQANIICRNFPLSPDELKKKLKIKDGGSEYLVFTTTQDEKLKVIHCKRI